MNEDEEAYDDHISSVPKHHFSTSTESGDAVTELTSSLIEYLRPVHQQWHLQQLLATVKKECSSLHEAHLSQGGLTTKLELQDVAQLYSYLLAVFSCLNSIGGLFPILNLLDFTQGFLSLLWEWLERFLIFK